MHIKESMMKAGTGEEAAERIGWATINSKKKKVGLGSLRKK